MHMRFAIPVIIMLLTCTLLINLPVTQNVQALRYSQGTPLTAVDASFIGVGDKPGPGAGFCVAAAGDVNNDGFMDILVGSHLNNEGGFSAGKTYLLFGKSKGWELDSSLSEANASFIGEDTNRDYSGYSVAGVGDMNNDGFDDILIGALGNDENGEDRGQSYLILGKASGWSRDTNLTDADASFIGDTNGSYSGWAVSGAGDVNADGFADLLIGARGSGQTFLVLGRASGWKMDMDLSSAADASFLGNGSSGWSVAGAGDVNADGFDDILIGAPGDHGGGSGSGRVFLVFGRASGWTMDMDLSMSANASFLHEPEDSGLGHSVAGAGDVNGDGYADILMGARWNNGHVDLSARSYLIFGKGSGWTMDTDLSSANASFIENISGDSSGLTVSPAGNVDNDEFDDFLVRAGSGRTYLFLGRTSGWDVDMDVSTADASFIGEPAHDQGGQTVAGLWDVNGDGYDDIMVGAPLNDDGGTDAGKAYLIFLNLGKGPLSVSSLKVYSDPAFIQETSNATLNQTIYIELVGNDGDPNNTDIATVDVVSEYSDPLGFLLYLRETGMNTGVYRNNFTLKAWTNAQSKWIKAIPGERILVTSRDDPTKNATLLVGLLALRPEVDGTMAQEDEPYEEHYWVMNGTASEWEFGSNASWLSWDQTGHMLSGTPDNGHVGSYWVMIGVVDQYGNHVEHNFTLVVNNTPPTILTENVLTATPLDEYNVDYASDDDGQGIVKWHLETNASWLDINTTSGLLSGTPSGLDIGHYRVNVSVDDGNGGQDRSDFILCVAGSIGPVIISEDVTFAFEDEMYHVDYSSSNEGGPGGQLVWHLETDASWLHIDAVSGNLTGVPGNDQVGIYWVNVSVKDELDRMDSSFFLLTVINVNDPPEFTSSPLTEVSVGSNYIYDVNGTDIDIGDILTYSVAIGPKGMVIDPISGLIQWSPMQDQSGEQQVIIELTDSNVTINQTFSVEVHPHLNATIDHPSQGQRLGGNPIASGTGKGPEGFNIEARIDSGDWMTVNGSRSWTFDMGTQNIGNGKHILTVRALWGRYHSEEVSVVFYGENQRRTHTNVDDGWTFWVFLIIIMTIISVIFLNRTRGQDPLC